VVNEGVVTIDIKRRAEPARQILHFDFLAIKIFSLIFKFVHFKAKALLPKK
jgi:hypothetical protein